MTDRMKNLFLPPIILLGILTTLPCSIGCGSKSDQPATPQQAEETRKQYIERAERMRKEG